MKKTIRTSRTAGQLEKMFRALNTHFFNDELPEAVISLKKRPSAHTGILQQKRYGRPDRNAGMKSISAPRR